MLRQWHVRSCDSSRWSLRWRCSGCFSVNGGDLTILQDNQVHYRGQLIVGVVPRALKLPATQQVSCTPTTRRRHNTEVRADRPRLSTPDEAKPGFHTNAVYQAAGVRVRDLP
jgi:xanthine dehydrogenase YagR molybdenum-binding subunit